MLFSCSHSHTKDLDAARYLAELPAHDGRYQFQYWAVSLVDAQPAQVKEKGVDGIKPNRPKLGPYTRRRKVSTPASRGKKFPRVQVLTVAELLDGTARAEHPDYEPDLNFKKARAESSGDQPALPSSRQRRGRGPGGFRAAVEKKRR